MTEVCFYCGVPADSVDHVIPRSLLRDLADDPQALASLTASGRVLEVDACRECNSRLGNVYDDTLEDRRARLKKKLRSRYRRLLEMPDWTDSELGRLGPYLQRRVIVKAAERDWIRARIAYQGAATRPGRRVA